MDVSTHLSYENISVNIENFNKTILGRIRLLIKNDISFFSIEGDCQLNIIMNMWLKHFN
jgi:hypothetical protein